ncbi:hypothetical protein [Erythrobacter litoralis]|uniref:Secreted protein n=1 Tax=Erythrobacter litoralis (strain HTCC2594) TaxID=314225 RepID=Q2N920_ERYLH|nr:hypothetical protein [Erythrobacter litoralis]ABC63821.1 hypothetical protein ELI_08645 [Erythrobacter litoralis HTCC2594]
MLKVLFASGVALAALSATPAAADSRGYNSYYGNGYQRAVERIERRCSRALRFAESRREYWQITRRCDAQLRDLRYRWNDDRRWRDDDDDDDDDDRRRWRGRDRDDDDDDD